MKAGGTCRALDIKGEYEWTIFNVSKLIENGSQIKSPTFSFGAYDWNLYWETNNSVSNRGKTLLISNQQHIRSIPFEGHFSLFEEEEFHEIILATRSSYFSRLLSSDCKEAKENIIHIKDVKRKVLEELLRFIYCVDVSITADNAENLLIAADMYQIKGLKNACEKYFCYELNEHNLSKCVLIANTFNAKILKSKTDEFIATKVLGMLRGVNSDVGKKFSDSKIICRNRVDFLFTKMYWPQGVNIFLTCLHQVVMLSVLQT